MTCEINTSMCGFQAYPRIFYINFRIFLIQKKVRKKALLFVPLKSLYCRGVFCLNKSKPVKYLFIILATKVTIEYN